jgi:hypothetical protein
LRKSLRPPRHISTLKFGRTDSESEESCGRDYRTATVLLVLRSARRISADVVVAWRLELQAVVVRGLAARTGVEIPAPVDDASGTIGYFSAARRRPYILPGVGAHGSARPRQVGEYVNVFRLRNWLLIAAHPCATSCRACDRFCVDIGAEWPFAVPLQRRDCAILPALAPADFKSTKSEAVHAHC